MARKTRSWKLVSSGFLRLSTYQAAVIGEAAGWVVAYLLREGVSTKVSHGELEASVLAIEDDLDSDQGVWTNWARVWIGGGHDER